jgi:hypothetical protein
MNQAGTQDLGTLKIWIDGRHLALVGIIHFTVALMEKHLKKRW